MSILEISGTACSSEDVLAMESRWKKLQSREMGLAKKIDRGRNMADAKSTMRTSGESEFGPFISSKWKVHFHRPDCKWIERVPPERRVEFGTHREAVEAGKKPCKTCRA